MISIKILFVLPVSGGGGGANSVIQESLELAHIGAIVGIAVKDKNVDQFASAYPELHNSGVALHGFSSGAILAEFARDYDVIVATTNGSVRDVKIALDEIRAADRPVPAYYIQDYEPLFYAPLTDKWREAFESYTLIPNCVLFAKTDWICDIVYENHGVKVSRVQASVDHGIYYPTISERQNRSVTKIVAMLRPQTPRRSPTRTSRILNCIATLYSESTDISVFGASDEQLEQFDVKLLPTIKNHGRMRRTEVPEVIRSADLFLDLSDFQAFGRTAIESMACGCVPIVPILGGATEFAVHGQNSFLVDTRSDEAIMTAISTYLSLNHTERVKMSFNALLTASRFTVRTAALSELALFWNAIKK